MMAFKRFTRGEMVSLSGPWIDPEHHEHQTLARVPATAALLPRLASAHGALLDTQIPADTTRWDRMRAARAAAYRTHDGLARALWHLLRGYIHLDTVLEDPRAGALAQLVDLMFPAGLRVVQHSYREIAGRAQLLASALTPARRQVLASLPADKGNVLDAVTAWIDAGRRIGALEDQLLAAPSPATGTARARNQWIRVMNTMRTVMENQRERAPELAPVLARLHAIDAQVDRRSRSRASGAGKRERPAPAASEAGSSHAPRAPAALVAVAGQDAGGTGELTLS